jgi:hypothetical protein
MSLIRSDISGLNDKSEDFFMGIFHNGICCWIYMFDCNIDKGG